MNQRRCIRCHEPIPTGIYCTRCAAPFTGPTPIDPREIARQELGLRGKANPQRRRRRYRKGIQP